MTANQAAFLLGNWLGGLVPAIVIMLLIVLLLRKPLTPGKATLAFLVTLVVTVTLTSLGNGMGSLTERLSGFGNPISYVFAVPPAVAAWALVLVWGWARDPARTERND